MAPDSTLVLLQLMLLLACLLLCGRLSSCARPKRIISYGAYGLTACVAVLLVVSSIDHTCHVCFDFRPFGVKPYRYDLEH